MKLSDYKEEVYKCSGCGICQEICPVFKILKKESAVSRGKFKLLNAIINGDMKYTHKTLEYMDLCLHCQACSEYCPSGIDAQKIIETAQFDMLSKGIINFTKIIAASVLANRKCMKIVSYFINLIRNNRILEKIDLFHCKNNKLARKLLKINISASENISHVDKTVKVLYFKGCVNNYVNPSTQNAVKKILDTTNVEILEADFNCCGLPYKTAGNLSAFKKIATENIKLAMEREFDYLIFDCASCKYTFLSYEQVLDDKYKQYLEQINSKIINIYELVDIINYEPKSKKELKKVAIHYPCHAKKSEDKILINKMLRKIQNVEICEMAEADSCCGAAGSFIFSNNKISKAISINKAKNIVNTGADTVITTCPSCVMGLKQGLISVNSDVEVLNLIEFLAQ